MKRKLVKLETRGQRIRAHRKMWQWLSENPKVSKGSWPGWEANRGRYPNQFADCFLCKDGCKLCPLIWPGSGICLETREGNGLFSKWSRSFWGSKERAKIAKQIAELPVRR